MVVPLRPEAGQQDGALDLGAGHGHAPVNGLKATAVDDERGAAVGRRDPRAHRAQRVDDALHRPAAQRVVARERHVNRPARDEPREQPQRRAGIAGVERGARLAETGGAAPGDGNAPGPCGFDAAPRAAMHATVDATSAPGARFVMAVVPAAMRPSIT